MRLKGHSWILLGLLGTPFVHPEVSNQVQATLPRRAATPKNLDTQLEEPIRADPSWNDPTTSTSGAMQMKAEPIRAELSWAGLTRTEIT